MDKTVNYAIYQQKLQLLKEKTKALLKATKNEALEQKLETELANINERQELKLAFVGQYSAGKSTIISALTGNKNIKIDANIATDVTSEYKWNNIILIDTPGILAGKVEAHDERTKAILKECDLIFYTLTSQLFDDVIFNNFIDLAYNQHLADKMFIVINKMGMENGSFDQLIENYSQSLCNTFTKHGYDFSKFPTAFIDANDYLEGLTDKDDEFIQISHFEHFIDMLNSFVNSKGLIKKQFDTPIRILQAYLKNIALSEIDPAIAEFYRQFEQRISGSQTDMKRSVSDVLYAFDSDAMSRIINLASEIGDIDETVWEGKQDSLNKNLTQLISTTSTTIEDVINQNYESLAKDISEFSNKDSLTNYIKNIDAKLKSPNISIDEQKNLNSQKRALEWLNTGASTIGKWAPGVNSAFGGISNASGSNLHNMVLNIGHYFGKSFQPWQAVRWASNIAKFAKFGIPIITTGLNIWMQVREKDKERERLRQIKESKNKFITGYQIEINKIKQQFENYLSEVLNNYNIKRDEINKSKNDIIQTAKRNNETNKSIKELEGEYVDFIEIINSGNA